MRQEERFKIPDRFTLVPAGPGEYRLHSLTFSLALRGHSSELLSRLLMLIDGQKTVADLEHDLETFGENSVREALLYLLEAGALERATRENGEPVLTAEMRRYQPQIAFLSHFVAPAQTPGEEFGPGMPRSGLEYQERIQRAHVVVFGVGHLGSQVIRSLVLAGVGKITALDSESVSDADVKSDSWFTADQEGHNRAEAACRLAAIANPQVKIQAAPEPTEIGELQERLLDSDFGVLCRDHFNPAEYEMFNLAALATKKSWTSARLSGFEFQIGPTIIPFQTSCYRCFDLRQKSNLPDLAEYEILENFLKEDRLRPEALAFTPGTGLVALEVLKAITWFMAPATCSHLYTLDLLTMESKLHPVLKIPRCPACGRPAQARPTIHAWQQSKNEIKP